MIKFEKVSKNEWVKSSNKENIYDSIKLPERATIGSAGYDFFSPFSFDLNIGETIIIPTGIRCKMDTNVVLMIYLRSSLGFKYQAQLDNGTGIIDSDYYNAENEGHIMLKITNRGNKTLTIKAQDRLCQGLFMNYLTTDNDNVNIIRKGGIGSTGR